MSRWTGASGYLIGGRLVLTAAHAVDYRRDLGDDGQLLVRTIAGSEFATEVLLVCDELSQVDLALLEITDSEFNDQLPSVSFAQVNRDSPAPVLGCWAVGFPWFGEAGPVLPEGSQKETWHVRGDILPGGKLRAGLLSLQVTSTPRPASALLVGSVWEGMSGAVTFTTDPQHGELAVGVITTHHRLEGESALTVIPITRVGDLTTADEWWRRLGVSDPAALPVQPRVDYRRQVQGMEPNYDAAACRLEAAEVYRGVLRRRKDHYAHRAAANNLARLGTDYVDEALEVLREIWYEDSEGVSSAVDELYWSASFLLSLFGQKDEAISNLRKLLKKDNIDSHLRVSAAKLLVSADPELAREAIIEFHTVLADIDGDTMAKVNAAHELLLLDFENVKEVVVHKLLSIALSIENGDFERLRAAARVVAIADKRYVGTVTPILEEIMQGDKGGHHFSHAIMAAQIVSLIDKSLRSKAVKAVLSLITDNGIGGYERYEGLEFLATLPSYSQADAKLITETLQPELSKYHFSSDDIRVAELLYRFTAGFTKADYGLVLRRAIDSKNIATRRKAAIELAALDSRFVPEAVAVLRRVVAEPAEDPGNYLIQVTAAKDLLRLGVQYARPTCGILQAVMTEAQMMSGGLRHDIAKILIECEGVESTISTVRQVLHSADNKITKNPYLLVEVASALAYCIDFLP